MLVQILDFCVAKIAILTQVSCNISGNSVTLGYGSFSINYQDRHCVLRHIYNIIRNNNDNNNDNNKLYVCMYVCMYVFDHYSVV